MDDKIYHNVTIAYNDAKLVSDDRNTSLAEATVQLMIPLFKILVSTTSASQSSELIHKQYHL